MKTIKTISISVLSISILFVAGCPRPLQYRGMLGFPNYPKHTEAEPFTFAVAGDSQGTHTQINKEVLWRLMDDIQFRDSNTAFLIVTGDMIHGSSDSQVAMRAMQEWQEIVTSHFHAPVVPVCGNHEIQTEKTQEVYRQLFGSHVPQNGPEDEKGLSYYFDYNRCRFIILDTAFYGDMYRVRHIDWLENVIKTARPTGVNHIFIFGHNPAWPVTHTKNSLLNAANAINGETSSLDATRRFWNLLKDYRVDAYFCGHEHVYARQNVNGVWQIISGGAGAPLGVINPGYPDTGASQRTKDTFEANKPYYEILGYPTGPGSNGQAGTHFVGASVFNYVLVDVLSSSVRLRMYGVKETDSLGLNFELMDQFELSPVPVK